MKSLFLLTCLLLISWSGWGQTKIKHPSLLFTNERVALAKSKIDRDTAYAKAWQEIVAQADQLLERPNPEKIEYVALAYQVTRDNRYADWIKLLLQEMAAAESFGNAEMLARRPAWRSELKMAWKAQQAAIGYDVIYDRLSAAERKQLAQGFYRVMVEPLLGDWLLAPTRIHSLNSMGHNWWTACINGGALLALAISNELPEAAEAAQLAVESLPEWFDFAGDVIQNKPKTFDRDGGMYESVNYANYGISQALLLRLAWINSHPGCRLEPIPQIDQIPAFFCQVAYPRMGELYSIGFGDSHKNVTGEHPMILAYALGVTSPETLWYIRQVDPYQFREGLPLHFPMGFLYTPDLTKAPAVPALPLSHLWSDFGWATLRDSWEKDATMLAVKSGMTWNHSHADANSLILFHKGVDLIKDAGNCNYAKQPYREYFFQSDAHNVVKFNGQGQNRYQQYHGSLLSGKVCNLLDCGPIKYVMADGTGPMSQWLNRNLRHFLWMDEVIYVIDDLHSYESGQFEWLWHPGGEIRKKGFDVEITQGDASLLLRPIYPKPLAYSDYVHDYPEDLYWTVHEGPTEDLDGTETYLSFHLPAHTDRVKALTASILKDSVNQQELPLMERREGKDWIGLRVCYRGTVTDLYINQLADGRLMHLNSWIEADGWETDAYLFAVSYPEGGNAQNPEEVFICHGSSVKRGKEVYFSSLSKLNLIADNRDNDLFLQVTGQPRPKFSFRGDARLVYVNGDKKSVTRNGALIQVNNRQNNK